MKSLGFALFSLFLSACATHPKVVSYHHDEATGKAKFYPPTLAKDVGIYRVTRPYEKFEEIGLITYKARTLHLERSYEKIRTEAAAKGADAVVDLKTKSEEHMETYYVSECSSIPACGDASCGTVQDCHDEPRTDYVTTYLYEGSLIRKK